MTCYICHRTGHYSDRCPDKRKRSSASSAKSNVTCYTCGQKGHYSDKCTSESKHMAAAAPVKNSQVVCYACRQTGHYSDKCPTRSHTQMPPAVSEPESKAVSAAPKEEPDMTCSICLSFPSDCTLGCGHLCMCTSCAESVSLCPLCRTPITIRIKTFVN